MARRDAKFDAFDAPPRPHGWRASLGGGVPLVRPSTAACRVALFVGASLSAYDQVERAPYAPRCAPPWASVVLDVEGAVAGTQFDRFARSGSARCRCCG